MKNKNVFFFLFTCSLLYMTAPYFFEKYLFFNELLSLSGFCILIANRFKVGKDYISQCLLLFLVLGIFHAIVSLFRMDSIYYYLRNSVILYSMFAYFIGYYGYPYFFMSIHKVKGFFRLYYTIFLLKPGVPQFFDRFSIPTSLPLLFTKFKGIFTLLILCSIVILHSYDYSAATSMLSALFFIFLYYSPSYRFFRQVMLVCFIAFAIVFIYLSPNLALIKQNYHHHDNYIAFRQVTSSHYLLSWDDNSIWRLVMWREYLFDRFPGNLLGYGFGTPVIFHFPIMYMEKVDTLPYVLGAHNSFITLFCRLGIFFIVGMVLLYTKVFKEYFYYRKYYEQHFDIFLFYSFFAFFMLCFFNPALETPLHAAGFWIILGLLSQSIIRRQKWFKKQKTKSFKIDY